MGFLDHSTNNIILDAVLTNTGRQFLAKNDGSFSIYKFALGDDEVNYNLIKKYGRTVGREKIEKNTPVFEAMTNQEHAQKYKMISISNPNLFKLPNLILAGASNVNGDQSTVTLARTAGGSGQSKANISLEQKVIDESSIDVELRDQIFIVQVPNLFCEISGQTPVNIDSGQIATYSLSRRANENSQGGSSVQFTLALKSLTNSLFNVYGYPAGTREYIKTYLRVTGTRSGAVKDITVIINK